MNSGFRNLLTPSHTPLAERNASVFFAGAEFPRENPRPRDTDGWGLSVSDAKFHASSLDLAPGSLSHPGHLSKRSPSREDRSLLGDPSGNDRARGRADSRAQTSFPVGQMERRVGAGRVPCAAVPKWGWVPVPPSIPATEVAWTFCRTDV
jgi:hypothetical protein